MNASERILQFLRVGLLLAALAVVGIAAILESLGRNTVFLYGLALALGIYASTRSLRAPVTVSAGDERLRPRDWASIERVVRVILGLLAFGIAAHSMQHSAKIDTNQVWGGVLLCFGGLTQCLTTAYVPPEPADKAERIADYLPPIVGLFASVLFVVAGYRLATGETVYLFREVRLGAGSFNLPLAWLLLMVSIMMYYCRVSIEARLERSRR